MSTANKARFILDLDSESWAAIHSALVGHLIAMEQPSVSIKETIHSLELQALNHEIMTKEDILAWRAEIMQQFNV